MMDTLNGLILAFRHSFAVEAARKRAERFVADARMEADSHAAIDRSKVLLAQPRPPYLLAVSADPSKRA